MIIPLEKISYDDLLKLSIEQNTQLFVKDKEIERLKEENYKLQKCLNEEELVVQGKNRELGIRIDKAIDYINEGIYSDYGDRCRDASNELLSILKGDEK